MDNDNASKPANGTAEGTGKPSRGPKPGSGKASGESAPAEASGGSKSPASGTSGGTGKSAPAGNGGSPNGLGVDGSAQGSQGQVAPKNKGGRPKGSKNKPKEATAQGPKPSLKKEATSASGEKITPDKARKEAKVIVTMTTPAYNGAFMYFQRRPLDGKEQADQIEAWTDFIIEEGSILGKYAHYFMLGFALGNPLMARAMEAPDPAFSFAAAKAAAEEQAREEARLDAEIAAQAEAERAKAAAETATVPATSVQVIPGS